MVECIFCKISMGKINSEIVYENDNFFSIFDAAPQVKGHSLVISKKHFENVFDLPNSLGQELLDCIKKTAEILLKKFECNGFNIVNNNFKSAGQIVDHVHFHILPRKNKDGYFVSLEKRKDL